jgi:hypothetical protein
MLNVNAMVHGANEYKKTGISTVLTSIRINPLFNTICIIYIILLLLNIKYKLPPYYTVHFYFIDCQTTIYRLNLHI